VHLERLETLRNIYTDPQTSGSMHVTYNLIAFVNVYLFTNISSLLKKEPSIHSMTFIFN